MAIKIQIVKTKEDKILIGSGGPHKDGFRLNVPFEIKKTNEGVTITPYDVEIIDTYIPFIDFYEYEYILEPESALANFYTNSSEKFVQEVKDRIAAGAQPSKSEEVVSE